MDIQSFFGEVERITELINGKKKEGDAKTRKKCETDYRIPFSYFRYFERSNGYLRLQDTNWVLFWHGKEGYQYVQDYAAIAKAIPASFH